jgi:hypothetical protein
MSEARRAAAGAALGLVLALGAAAPAAQSEKPAPVTVSILSVRATKEAEPSCDPALEPIRTALARSGYNTFRLLKRESRAVQPDQSVECAMAENYALHVKAERADKDNVKMCITWVRHEKDQEGKPKAVVLQRIPLTIRNGKHFLSGGWKLEKGAVLGAVAGQ